MPKKKIIDVNDSEIVTRKILREELRGFATKEDLKRFATKEDLKRFATKEDLKKYATKDDLFDFGDHIISSLKGYMDEFKSEIMSHIDWLAKDNETLKEENTVGTHQIRNLRVKVDNHEKRLKALEAA